ncbi:MAG: C4-dicarboxylate transporter DctA [Ralstonia sp.]|uniref:C4-dicarboxylate transporter DctA n=1 Tax=Ralstonia sp. TaxID=54061 RepID=UPI003F7E4A67
MQRFTRPLFGQVLIALALGIALGVWAPDFAQHLKPLGDGFLKLIQMLITPIVFSVVVVGICGAGELKKVGRVGGKAVVYFEVVTTIALALGIALAYLFGPGHGMNVDPKTLDPAALSTYMANAEKMHSGGFATFFLGLIPDTFVSAFAKGDVLQVLVLSILFGCALSMLGERTKPVVAFIDQFSQVLFRMMAVIIRLAPLGVLGAVAFTVGKYGAGSLKQLGFLVLLFYAAVTIFVVVVLGTILRLAGFNIFKLIRFLRAELVVVAGTASSDAVLPSIMNKLEKMGIKRSVVGLVIPTGYSFNLDAFSIYLTLAAVFIAQATNTSLSLHDLLLILAVALITSKGAHGIPGSAIVILAATLSVIPAIPAIGLVLVLSVDWFIGIARALGNLIGNCVATVVIAAWEKDIDRVRANAVLDGKIDITEEGEAIAHSHGVAAQAAHTLPHA